MENKDDWKELEQWAENKEIESKEKFGLDINKINMQKKEKNMNTFVKVLNTMGKASKVFLALIVLLLVFIIFIFIDVNFSNMKNQVNGDVESVLKRYNIKAQIVTKEIDEHENGKYIFALKNNAGIKFTAIKKWGAVSEDFEDNYQKYIFDNWNSDIKNKFTIKESINEKGLLNYENIIAIKGEDELSEATECLIKFLEYSEKWNKENEIVKNQWQKEGQFIVPIKVYIKIQNKTIYPYNAMYQTADEIRSEAQKAYKQ